MRVLVVHNMYASAQPSGENLAVEEDVRMLEAAGVQVLPLYAHSDDIAGFSSRAKLATAIGPLYSRRGVTRLRDALAATDADVVHVHNVFPLWSPMIIRESHRRGRPVVQTLHNYRHTCIAGTHLRNERLCTDCVTSDGGTLRVKPLPGVQHGCYRGSRLQSLPMAASQKLHQQTWLSVDAYIALTPFMKQRMHELGVPEERVSVRPTPVQDPGEPQPPSGCSVLFVGRLDASKGVDQLLLAWQQASLREAGWNLRIVGEGPLAGSVRSAAARDVSIDFQGRQAGEALSRCYEEAAVVCVPSQWYEGFPRVLAEATSHGRAVLVSDLGGLADIARAAGGFVIGDTSAATLSTTLDSLRQADLSAAGAASRAYYLRELSPGVALNRLLATYEETATRGTS